MRKSAFTKHIGHLEKEELIEELLMLFDRIPEVKEFYKMELGSEGERQKTYAKAKKDIEAKFRTKSFRKPRRPRIQKVRKLLSELKKKSVFEHELIDIYLHTSEVALDFSITYNFNSTPVFNIIKDTFKSANDIVLYQKMQQEYKERCYIILRNSHLYYGLHNELLPIFEKVYEI